MGCQCTLYEKVPNQKEYFTNHFFRIWTVRTSELQHSEKVNSTQHRCSSPYIHTINVMTLQDVGVSGPLRNRFLLRSILEYSYDARKLILCVVV